MEELERYTAIARSAMDRFDGILREPFLVIVRDAAIKRFDFSYEIAWKLTQLWLKEYHGVDCRSPKGCFREAAAAGLTGLDDAEALLAMANDRNLTTHTYTEEMAQFIF